MKIALPILIVAAMVLSILATSAFAASRSHGSRFVDANNDGVCDNRQNGVACPRNGNGYGRKGRK